MSSRHYHNWTVIIIIIGCVVALTILAVNIMGVINIGETYKQPVIVK